MAYIDTSVLVAYYCPEPFSRACQEALGRHGAPAVSPLVELEFHSALASKVRARELDAAAGRRILTLFAMHLADGSYRVVPIEAGEYRLARDWIGGFSIALRAPDALHLAAALANGLVLLTADKAMARAAAQLGVQHELIG
jgi:predicted nucleic acid-binding protein